MQKSILAAEGKLPTYPEKLESFRFRSTSRQRNDFPQIVADLLISGPVHVRSPEAKTKPSDERGPEIWDT